MLVDSVLKQKGLSYLRAALGDPHAKFRDGQWEAIEAVVQRREKLLVVQRTGWGKSIVYFLATKLLREAGAGPTLLVSPLLSLMRNQIDAAGRLGVVAESINSTNRDDWNHILEELTAGRVDILLISPERLSNENFVSQILPTVAPKIGLFVVDEAHCISDWGHDFRPDYMRIARILRALPPNAPAMATTATANDRVVEDVAAQLGNLRVVRGPLTRRSLRLQNIDMPSTAARMAWLAQMLPVIPGTGIVYTLTIRDAERLAEWLRHKGIAARAYHSDGNKLSTDDKLALEQKLLRNEIKALVATVALGMGFDKPDLGFVIHFQRPASVVHYYQQVGRAGRAVDRAYGVLLGGSEDDEIADYFLRTAFPPQAHVTNVLELLEKSEDGLSIQQIMGRVNLRMDQIQKVLTVLSVESPSPVVKQGMKYFRTTALFDFDMPKLDQLVKTRKNEQQRMRDYLGTTDCLMRFLAAELDDPQAEDCGMCACCTKRPLLRTTYDLALAAEASAFLRRSDVTIEPRLIWPSGSVDDGYRGKIPEDLRAEAGRTLCMWGDAGWGELVRRGKQKDDRFDEQLIDAAAEMLVARWKPTPFPRWVTAVPSLKRAALVPNLAQRLAVRLKLPYSPCVVKVRDTQPQKLMNNSHQQLKNIQGAFEVDQTLVLSGPVLLVDDMTDSKWTFTLIATLLRDKGSGPVFPIALAKTAY